ncbi:MAG: hypothetical protein KDC46_06060 [Thermoleophilia bacterium]|nr:hypothetical protein [Thermoleophilia bacterium]
MPGLALTTGLVLGTLGVASATALDVAIDRSGHDHESTAYTAGSLPTQLLGFGGGALVAAGLGALAIPGLRSTAAPVLLKLGAGTLGAWAATFGVRLGIGMLFDPSGTGMKFNPGDIARNSIDRTHMMGRESMPHEQAIFNAISTLQGHGSYEERLARGEFAPVWQPGDQPRAAFAASAASAAGTMSRS